MANHHIAAAVFCLTVDCAGSTERAVDLQIVAQSAQHLTIVKLRAIDCGGRAIVRETPAIESVIDEGGTELSRSSWRRCKLRGRVYIAEDTQIIVSSRAERPETQCVLSNVEFGHRERLRERMTAGKDVRIMTVVSAAAIGGLRLDFVATGIKQEERCVDRAEARRERHVTLEGVVE